MREAAGMMTIFPSEEYLENIPYLRLQGLDLEVPRPGRFARANPQRRGPQSRGSTARTQNRLSTILENPDFRPCSIASSESSISKGSEPTSAIPSHVEPPTDYQIPPPISQILISETVVYEYRISGPYPEADSYRYQVPAERVNTRQERGNRHRERGNTHREFYQHPNSSNSSEIPNTARRERIYRDGLVEIDDDWRYRDLGYMYRGEEVDHMRRDRAREYRVEERGRQREREPGRDGGCGLEIRCVIL